ncbi:MAG TPA: hypothetical protein VFG47_17355 [Geminicoccaceae bacterium]|nr:hypothetical protein [Geminicoccaceae bacterium]
MGYLRFVIGNGRFLAFGLLFSLCSSCGQTFFIALFGGEIRAAFDLSHGGFGTVYAAGTLASGPCLMWLGRASDRVDLRAFGVLVAPGLALACLGYVAVGTVPLASAARRAQMRPSSDRMTATTTTTPMM